MTTDTRPAPVQFRPGSLAGPLAARGDNPNEVAARDLERYYAVLASELRGLHLSEAAASLILDALNGTLIEAHTYPLTGYGILEAIRLDHLGDRWLADQDAFRAFMDWLPTVRPTQWLAIVDACERFWQTDAALPMPDRLRAVGLVRPDA